MKRMTGIFIRVLVLLALLLTSALAYAQDEKETESAAAPFIGIRYWPHADGLFVTGIIPNTPAAEADLQAGDIVEAVNGEAIRVETVRDVVWKHDAGATVALSIDRDGRAFDLDLTLMARPADLFENPDYALPLDLAAVGLYVGQCNDMLIVIGALAGSDIAAGFQVYDQIIEIDGETVHTIGEADAAVSALSEGDELSFRLLRAERELVVKVIAEDHRRRDPRQRPPRRPHPRLEVERAYVSENIELGYGDGFVVVSELNPAHDLYAAGLRQFDLIVEANGAPVEEAVDLFRDGDTIEVAIERMNSTLHFDIPVSAAPLLMIGDAEPVEQNRSQWLGLHEKQVTLGVRYLQLEPDSPHFEGSEAREGALVAEVIEGLPAAKAGVQDGDIIVAVAGEPVTLEIDLRNRIYFHEPGERVTLDILRAGEIIQIEVTLRVASN